MSEERPEALGLHLVPDAESVARALIELRGEFNASTEATRGEIKLGLADLRLEIARATGEQKLQAAALDAKADAIIERLDYTNGKVGKHEDLLAKHFKRHDDQEHLDALKRARWDERWRLFRFAWQGWRLVNRTDVVVRLTALLMVLIVAADRWEWSL